MRNTSVVAPSTYVHPPLPPRIVPPSEQQIAFIPPHPHSHSHSHTHNNNTNHPSSLADPLDGLPLTSSFSSYARCHIDSLRRAIEMNPFALQPYLSLVKYYGDELGNKRNAILLLHRCITLFPKQSIFIHLLKQYSLQHSNTRANNGNNNNHHNNYGMVYSSPALLANEERKLEAMNKQENEYYLDMLSSYGAGRRTIHNHNHNHHQLISSQLTHHHHNNNNNNGVYSDRSHSHLNDHHSIYNTSRYVDRYKKIYKRRKQKWAANVNAAAANGTLYILPIEKTGNGRGRGGGGGGGAGGQVRMIPSSVSAPPSVSVSVSESGSVGAGSFLPVVGAQPAFTHAYYNINNNGQPSSLLSSSVSVNMPPHTHPVSYSGASNGLPPLIHNARGQYEYHYRAYINDPSSLAHNMNNNNNNNINDTKESLSSMYPSSLSVRDSHLHFLRKLDHDPYFQKQSTISNNNNNNNSTNSTTNDSVTSSMNIAAAVSAVGDSEGPVAVIQSQPNNNIVVR